MNEVFQINYYTYDLRNPRILVSRHKSTLKHDTNIFNGAQIWLNIPLETRNLE